MGRRHSTWILTLAAVMGALGGCGDGLDEAAARQLWQSLDAALVARPIDVDYFAAGGVFSAPVHCVHGEGVSSVNHTATWGVDTDDTLGQLTGNIVYTLRDCELESRVQLRGTLRRAFHATQRTPHAALPRQQLTDAIFGTVEADNALHGRCVVDVTRVLAGDAARFTGSLCGHDAASVLRTGPLTGSGP